MANQRIIELIEQINKRKEGRDSIAATYRDSSDLKELAELVSLERNLSFAYDVLVFISEQYESMGRFSVAGIYRLEALKIAEGLDKDFDEMLYAILRDRNYYVDDDCNDVRVIVDNLLPEETIEKLFNTIKRRRRSLKHDPVEMSKEYLDCIDEIEEKIEKNRTYSGLGSCHEIWDLKYRFLLEKGIVWKSPAVLNPRVMFD